MFDAQRTEIVTSKSILSVDVGDLSQNKKRLLQSAICKPESEVKQPATPEAIALVDEDLRTVKKIHELFGIAANQGNRGKYRFANTTSMNMLLEVFDSIALSREGKSKLTISKDMIGEIRQVVDKYIKKMVEIAESPDSPVNINAVHGLLNESDESWREASTWDILKYIVTDPQMDSLEVQNISRASWYLRMYQTVNPVIPTIGGEAGARLIQQYPTHAALTVYYFRNCHSTRVRL